jgi:hypothetical protein
MVIQHTLLEVTLPSYLLVVALLVVQRARHRDRSLEHFCYLDGCRGKRQRVVPRVLKTLGSSGWVDKSR